MPFIETVSGFDTVWRDGILRRIDRVPTIRAQADPRPGVLASVAEDSVRAEIEAIELPPGYSFAWRGESGDSAEANKNLASTLPLGLLAMVFVVVLLFNALRQPLIIWLVVPLAIIGVVAGLLVTGSALEFMAILGVLSLSGLLIKNAIVLVDQMDLEIREENRATTRCSIRPQAVSARSPWAQSRRCWASFRCSAMRSSGRWRWC